MSAVKPTWLLQHLEQVRGNPNYLPDGRRIVLSRPGEDGALDVIYAAWPKQLQLHENTTSKFLLEGERGTGKSHCLRWDAHLKALSYPGYKYLILRRTTGELRKSHLTSLASEMAKLGGRALGLRNGNTEAHYPNGSLGMYGHCEHSEDVEKYLSAEFFLIVFDEIVTFEWEMVTKIAPSCRVPEGSGLTALIRGGTNPLGCSADEVQRYFIAKDLTPEEDPEYNPNDWGSLHMVMDDNPSLDKVQYLKQFAGLPEAYRRGWLQGEWGVEGRYFTVEPCHIITELPRIVLKAAQSLNLSENMRLPMLECTWLNVYRLLDWGLHDPTVCLWVAVLPNGRHIAFMERSWIPGKQGLSAGDIALEIKRESDGMKVITTLADPTMWDGERELGHCLADEFETRGISLTKARNDRTACGLAIQNYLNSILDDGMPKLQIYDNGEGAGCPTLNRTLRAMRVDKRRPGRIADSKLDHFPIVLGYMCMAGVAPSRIPDYLSIPRWMVPKPGKQRIIGSTAVRNPRAR